VGRAQSLRHGERRDAILDAAKKVFIHYGLQRASISGICAEAGISPGHLYHYFGSKDEIVEAMAEAYLALVRKHFVELAACGNVAAAIENELRRAAEASKNKSHGMLFDMIAEAGRNARIAEILACNTRSIRQLLAELIQNGQRNGEVRSDLDPLTAASTIMGMIDAIKTMARRDEKVDIQAVVDLTSTMARRLISPD
jgi:AcrR family transcriptional regulator